MKKMNKKIIIIIFSIIVLLLCSYGVYKYFNVPYKHLDLNYRELNEDIKSIEKNGSIKHATLIGEKSFVNDQYQGDGYIIKEMHGGECIEYFIYHNGKVIWEYRKIFPLEKR